MVAVAPRDSGLISAAGCSYFSTFRRNAKTSQIDPECCVATHRDLR